MLDLGDETIDLILPMRENFVERIDGAVLKRNLGFEVFESLILIHRCSSSCLGFRFLFGSLGSGRVGSGRVGE